MEVKINKNNNQKYVTIPQESLLKQGDKVKVVKIKNLNLNDLKNYFEKNKDKFKKFKLDMISYYSTRDIVPEAQIIKNFKETFEIIDEYQGTYNLYKLEDIWVYYDIINDEIVDSENFNFIGQRYGYDIMLNITATGGLEFDENKFTKEQLKNCAILRDYIELNRMYEKQRREIENQFFADLGFEFYENASDEHENGWINYEESVVLVHHLTSNPSEELEMTLEPFENKHPNRIEYDISGLLDNVLEERREGEKK